MNKTKIDWGIKDLYTWNPVIGCKHGCSYCYAKRINDRFHYISEWTAPVLFQHRLDEPWELKKPSTIFVGSMCDLFGEWVSTDWIKDVLSAVKHLPQHIFMFLTKNPWRYKDFQFTSNCRLGTTIESNADNRRVEVMDTNCGISMFLSIEPIIGSCEGLDLACFEYVIVGAMTGPRAVKPKQEWLDSIKHSNIYWKPSISTELVERR